LYYIPFINEILIIRASFFLFFFFPCFLFSFSFLTFSFLFLPCFLFSFSSPLSLLFFVPFLSLFFVFFSFPSAVFLHKTAPKNFSVLSLFHPFSFLFLLSISFSFFFFSFLFSSSFFFFPHLVSCVNFYVTLYYNYIIHYFSSFFWSCYLPTKPWKFSHRSCFSISRIRELSCGQC
jgi:hypothetical protein